MGKWCIGDPSLKARPRELKAFAEGRQASIALEAANTNPHVADTPEAEAWDRGWETWEAGGTDRYLDCTGTYVRTIAP